MYILTGVTQMTERSSKERQFINYVLHTFVNHLNAWNAFRAIVSDFEKEESMYAVNHEKPKIGSEHITGSLETYENVREEMSLYLQVYNNASQDKLYLNKLRKSSATTT